MAYIVPIFIEKGGVGKTTTAVHLSHAAALRGVRVLVVDTDPQLHASEWLYPGEPPALTLNEVVRTPETLREAIKPSRITDVDVLYGSRRLPNVAESVLKVDEDGNPRNPFEVLKRVFENVREDYDLILIDCAPSISLLSSNALVAANHVLAPTTLAALSFKGVGDLAKTLVQLCKNGLIPEIPPFTLVLTQTKSGQSRTTEHIRERICEVAQREHHPYTLLKNTIRYREQMEGIFDSRLDAFDLAATGEFRFRHLQAVADDYMAVAREFAVLLLGQDAHPQVVTA